MQENLELAADFINKKLENSKPVLGLMVSGMDFLSGIRMHELLCIPISEIPGFPVAVFKEEASLMIFETAKKMVISFCGQMNFPSAGNEQQMAFPIRLMKYLGAESMILIDTAIVLNDNRSRIFILNDHVNFMGFNPLSGFNDDRFGPRFPDMSAPYDAGLSKVADAIFNESGFKPAPGIYAGLNGDMLAFYADFEKHLNKAGADLVGDSIIQWVIAAVHSGLKTLALVIPESKEAIQSESKIPNDFYPAFERLLSALD